VAKKLNCQFKKHRKINIEWGELLPISIEDSDKTLKEYFTTFDLSVCKQIMWMFLRESITGHTLIP
jgi:hypothetical protein